MVPSWARCSDWTVVGRMGHRDAGAADEVVRGSLSDGDRSPLVVRDGDDGGTTRNASSPVSGVRDGSWRTRLVLIVAPVLSLVIAVSFVASCVGESFSHSGAGGSSVVSRDAKEKIVRADVDTEGLREIAEAVEAMESAPTGGGVNELWADRLIYWDQSNDSNSTMSWPVPDGAGNPDRYCFNSTAVHAYILTTGDWSMTDDRGIEECRKTWKAAWSGADWDTPVTWPWDEFEMWHEKVGLHWQGEIYASQPVDSNHSQERWNDRNLPEAGQDVLYERVKKALMEGHPVYGGAGHGEQIYNADGSTWAPAGGHAFLWYKHDPVEHVFYAKDSCCFGGSCVPYPEHGGKIDPYGLITSGDSYWVEDADAAKVACPPSAEALQVLRQAELEMPDPPYIGTRFPLYARGTWGNLYSKASESEGSGTSARLDGEDAPAGGTDWEALATSSAGRGGDGTAWLSDVLGSLGLDPPWGSACEAYWSAVGDGCQTTSTDPSLSTLSPGMVLAVPHVPSEDEERRVLGLVGLCVGERTVAYDDGGEVVVCDASMFVRVHEGVCPVAWWRPTSWGGDSEDSGASVSLPSPSLIPGLDMRSVGRQAATCLADEGLSADDVTGTHMVGQTVAAGTTVVGYVLTLGGGGEFGIDVISCDGRASVVAADWVAVDGQVLYGTESGCYVPIGTSGRYAETMDQVLEWMSHGGDE